MGAKSRRKGAVGERLLAAELREAFPALAEQIHRGWQSRDGADDADVVGLPGFWFESKNTKAPRPLAALQQAIEAAKGRGVPVAVVRGMGEQPVAVLRWSDFLEIMKPFVAGRG